MADEPTTTVPGTTTQAPAGPAGTPPATAPAPAAGGTPPAVAPPATAPAAAAPAAAPAAAAAAPPARKTIVIPREEMTKRVRRDALKLIQDELGISLDDAKAVLKKRDETANQPPQPTERELALQRELAEAKDKLGIKKKRIENLKARHQAELLEAEITQSALSSGVIPDEVDYALLAYQRFTQTPEFEAKPQQPGEFFAGLKAKKPHLFVGGVAAPPPRVVPIGGSTAAPESTVPGGGPSATQPAVVAKPVSVDDMTDAEFKAYRARHHNFRG